MDARPEHASVKRRSLLASIGGAVAVLSASRVAVALADDTVSMQPTPVALTSASQTSNSDIKTVLVVGATGATGSRVVQQLAERGLEVRAGTRDVDKAEASGVRGAVKADVLDPRRAPSMCQCDAALHPTLQFGGLIAAPRACAVLSTKQCAAWTP